MWRFVAQWERSKRDALLLTKAFELNAKSFAADTALGSSEHFPGIYHEPHRHICCEGARRRGAAARWKVARVLVAANVVAAVGASVALSTTEAAATAGAGRHGPMPPPLPSLEVARDLFEMLPSIFERIARVRALHQQIFVALSSQGVARLSSDEVVLHPSSQGRTHRRDRRTRTSRNLGSQTPNRGVGDGISHQATSGSLTVLMFGTTLDFQSTFDR